MMSSGWWTLTRVRGAPIRVHWTLLAGAFIWGGFRFEPAFWLGFATLILLHELGHALFVVRYRLGLSEIALHGAGGYCAHLHTGSRYQAAVVAWGGVLAQLALFLALQAGYALFGPPSSYQLAVFLGVFGRTNLYLIALNLIPFEPLDGAKAWPLFGMLAARLRNLASTRKASTRRHKVQNHLRLLERLDTDAESPDQKTDRIVRDLIARTTQPKDH